MKYALFVCCPEIGGLVKLVCTKNGVVESGTKEEMDAAAPRYAKRMNKPVVVLPVYLPT